MQILYARVSLLMERLVIPAIAYRNTIQLHYYPHCMSVHVSVCVLYILAKATFSLCI